MLDCWPAKETNEIEKKEALTSLAGCARNSQETTHTYAHGDVRTRTRIERHNRVTAIGERERETNRCRWTNSKRKTNEMLVKPLTVECEYVLEREATIFNVFPDIMRYTPACNFFSLANLVAISKRCFGIRYSISHTYTYVLISLRIYTCKYINTYVSTF